jgi:hypothetical protein
MTYKYPELNEAYDEGANAAESWVKKQLDTEIQEVIDGLRNAPPQDLHILDAAQGRIDDLVHHAKSEEASDTNNKGFEGQVQFLLEYGITKVDIIKALKGE